ncbi:MAG: carboxylesterase family protein, partial [Asticcacaulis sp.]
LDVDATGTVHHGSELAFVFNPRPAGKTEAQWPALLDYWANFAKTGDPNGEGVAVWPDFGRAGRFIEFSPDGPLINRDMRGAVCRYRDQP